MELRRSTPSVFRAVAMWLLALAMFFGPAGVGTSTALAAAPDDCGVECPCDDAQEGHDEESRCSPCEANELHEADDDPCEELCPDSCHECSCCFSVAVELDCVPVVWGARASARLSIPSPSDAPSSATAGSVFRPPRSLV